MRLLWLIYADIYIHHAHCDGSRLDARQTDESTFHYHAVSIRGSAVRTRQTTAVRRVAPQQISARYRGHGTDLAKVPEFQRHDADTGSPEAQVARLTARVAQLTAHLKQHKTDYSTTRGLMAILSKRKQLLKYLRSNDKEAYERCVAGLGIRQLK